jgi:hypothetical protein
MRDTPRPLRLAAVAARHLPRSAGEETQGDPNFPPPLAGEVPPEAAEGARCINFMGR